MSQTLNDLLTRIDPQRSIDRLEQRVHRALATFQVPFKRIRSYQQLRLLLAYFEFRLAHWPNARSEQFPMQQAKGWYDTVYKRMRARFGEMPERTIMYIAQTGVDGGLYGVLRRLADHYVFEQSRQYIHKEVDDFWQRLSGPDQREAINQYWRRYQRFLLPNDLASPRDWRLSGNFPSVLRKHPQLVRNRRRIGKAFHGAAPATPVFHAATKR
jgi:hypothetical protein